MLAVEPEPVDPEAERRIRVSVKVGLAKLHTRSGPGRRAACDWCGSPQDPCPDVADLVANVTSIYRGE